MAVRIVVQIGVLLNTQIFTPIFVLSWIYYKTLNLKFSEDNSGCCVERRNFYDWFDVY